MQKFVILASVWIVACLVLTGAASANGGSVHVAKGDTLHFLGVVPDGSTQYRIWAFGYHDDISTAIMASDGKTFDVTVPDTEIAKLNNGEYVLYIQFSGKNGMMDFDYHNSTLTSIYRSVPTYDLTGLTSEMKRYKFDEFKSIKPIDDAFVEYALYVEDPQIKIVNMYNMYNGGLHIDASTNIAVGNRIDAIIDEETYAKSPYREVMSNSSVVQNYGGDNKFWLEFPNAAASQLTSGMHTIDVHYLKTGITAIPFKRHIELATPTPTPIINHYYDFTGEELGYTVNTTRPFVPVTTIPVTPVETPVTVLAEVHINNRTIEQRGNVYVGEKNLDVWGTLGWQDFGTSNYDFNIQYCDGDGTIITVKNPHHFDVDYETFGSRLGAWCQYQSTIDEPHPPIAFMVRNPAGANLTDPYAVPVVTPLPNETVNESVVQVVPSSAAVETPTTIIPTPEQTEALVVPSPWWIAIVGIAVAVMVRKNEG